MNKEFIGKIGRISGAYIFSLVVVFPLSFFGMIEPDLYYALLRAAFLIVVLIACGTSIEVKFKNCDEIPIIMWDLLGAMRTFSFIVIMLIPTTAIFDGILMKIIFYGIDTINLL